MRLSIVFVVLFACGKGESGLEAAKKAEEADLKNSKDKGEVAKKLIPPVAGGAHVPCSQLIDAAAFTTALGEKEPLTVRDDTKSDGDAAAVCSLIRGGKVLSPAEQNALLKKQARLGVMAGDPVCQVSAYCWTFEDDEHLRKKCSTEKNKDDDTMGTYACLQVVATGQDDVNLYKFVDPDTKCLIKVGPGGSNIDNDMIRNCAKTARDSIGPAQIAPGGAPAAPAGSGSAK